MEFLRDTGRVGNIGRRQVHREQSSIGIDRAITLASSDLVLRVLALFMGIGA
jgi:hypothetical protein